MPTNAAPHFAPRPHRKALLQVPCTREELEIVRDLARREGITHAEYVRRLVAERYAQSEHQAAA